ncbi:MAG: lipoyl domain-containing protein [Candidatus Omnitrophica bacterium]|nr:lipoyl domain-containing protein [Candidatus Omnitrophota bacterium]MDD5237257.1 lipoyl domain-containing protein [Candidatus Omnitrophota bacterium]MDD5610350.1 lipoyl domain-containing protein [Candidatus Omnitrophota bacterium]
MTKVILPELGEGINKATVSYWYRLEGEKVEEKEDLVELTTDKATFNLPSPCSGKIVSILRKEGEAANVGETLAEIEENS